MPSKNESTIIAALIILACLTITPTAGTGTLVPAAAPLAKWTFMIYMDGDNNLDPAALADMAELETVGSSDQLQIICLMDRASWANDWTNTRLYRVIRDGDPDKIGSTLLEDYPEKDMGNPGTLMQFLAYCFANYPAENYLLDLWDHASGIASENSPGGICIDDTSGRCLTIADVCSVLSGMATKVDVLSSDACLMANAEVFHDFGEIIDTGGYVVSSEESVPNPGYPYDTICEWLASSIDATPQELAYTIVDKFDECYNQEATLAALSAAACESIASSIDQFATAVLAVNSTIIYENFLVARPSCGLVDSKDYVDLYHFMDAITTGNATIQSRAADVKSAITSNIYYKGRPDRHGISIYMPKYQAYPAYMSWCDMCDEYHWDELIFATYDIRVCFQTGDDIYEENDNLASAKTIYPFLTYQLYWKDGDYFKMTASAGASIALFMRIAQPSTHLDLFVYQGSQITDWADPNNDVPIQSQLNIAGSGTLRFSAPADDSYYLRIRYAGGDNSLYTIEFIIDEPFESGSGNDDISNAVPLNQGILYTNLTHADDDWYSITGISTHALLVMNLSFGYAPGNTDDSSTGILDISLYNPAGVILKTVAGTACPKILKYYVTKNETLKIRVFGSDTSVLYSIRWDELALTDDTYEQNDNRTSASTLPSTAMYSLAGLDDDWFNFTLGGGQWLDVTLTFGVDADLDLFLYKGDVLVDASATGRHVERVVYSSQQPCTVYLLVSVIAFSTSYELNYSSPAYSDDSREDDDDTSSATLLAPVLDGPEVESSGWSFDPDYFSFSVPSAAELILHLSCVADLDAMVLDDSGNMLQYAGTSGSGENLSIRLPAGSYFICVIPYVRTGNYTIGIRLASVQPDYTMYIIIGVVAAASAAVAVVAVVLYRRKHVQTRS